MSVDDVGYKKPPRAYQFKKNQSGCPSGGWEQRRANEKARKAKQKQREKELAGRLRAAATRMRTVSVDGKKVRMMEAETVFEKIQNAAQKGHLRSQQLYDQRLEKLGLYSTPEDTQRTGVVVVERPYATNEQWLAVANATRVPVDPLEGLPGIDPAALKTRPARGAKVSPDDDED